MKYGFTGSRMGPTRNQRAALARFIIGSGDDNAIEEWHHGCCVGSDEFSHIIARSAWPIVSKIHLHPPDDPKLEMTYTDWEYQNCIWSPKKPYLVRDRDIVDETDELVATPIGAFMYHSGTWYTIQYAQELNKPVHIIWPDGSFERA